MLQAEQGQGSATFSVEKDSVRQRYADEVASTTSPSSTVRTLPTLFEEDYDVKQLLGQGRFAKVQEVVRKGTKKRFAVKVMESSKESETEMQLLAGLQHSNIVRLHQSREQNQMLYMILELCSGGTLKSWIANRYEQGVSKMPVYMAPSRSLVANCLWQILDATRYLHEQGFVHRDVKPENLLVLKTSFRPQLKLADFNVATAFQRGELMTKRCGSLGYMAPEVVKGSYSELCDLWSVGVVFYEMATGMRLWPSTQTNQQHYDQVLAEVPLTLQSNEYWRHLGDGHTLAQELLSLESFGRPTASSAMDNDWLRKYALASDEGCCSIS
ncbi:unc-43 [Symbiodinium sp. KB8]|nr:unc-43 [Symbiodinium sp. KB8]